MTFEDNFNYHSKEYIFSNDNFLSNERQNIFNKIKLKDFDNKNNESLKNISFLDLSLFDYYYNLKDEDPKITLVDQYTYKINIVNGVCKNYEDDNIEIRNITNLDSKKFEDQNDKNLDDLVIDFNKIFLNSGIFFNVKKNKKLKLDLVHTTYENYTIFQNNFFSFQDNCEVELQDDFNLSNNTINNINYNIQANQGSVVQHNIFQNFSNSNKLYLTTNTVCAKKSSFIQNTYNFADGFVRNFHYAKLKGEFSKVSLKGCFFLKNKNICSNKTHVVHNAANCESDQTYKGILNNYAKANYFSNTFVSKNAQKTEGYQLSKGILLTDNCSFFSKPELRIFADDVKCSHGSTIGPVDESALYYLRSRGINKNEAMKMIISSFIEEDLQKLDKKIAERIYFNLSDYLGNLI
ncbi:SufD family Fe-S cluster assembly protein [Pelagibacteraceae bacterium]|nr:SufD family Fe-S cluster assembly protein [Pelagibacteraceae bacterium]